jgi:hypothetical protein
LRIFLLNTQSMFTSLPLKSEKPNIASNSTHMLNVSQNVFATATPTNLMNPLVRHPSVSQSNASIYRLRQPQQCSLPSLNLPHSHSPKQLWHLHIPMYSGDNSGRLAELEFSLLSIQSQRTFMESDHKQLRHDLEKVLTGPRGKSIFSASFRELTDKRLGKEESAAADHIL